MNDANRSPCRSHLALCLVGALLGLPSGAFASCAGLEPVPAVLEVTQGMQRELRFAVPITRLAIADPEVADVSLNGKDSFLLLGKRGGTTSLMVWTRCDLEPRQSMVAVQGAATAAVAEPVVRHDDDMVPSQVQTDIRFVEVRRSKLREVGLRIFGTASNNFLIGAPGTGPATVPVGGVGGVGPGAAFPLSRDGFNIVWGGGSSKFLLGLDALENSGFAYTLARPSLVSLNGQSASFLAGGEFPIPVPSSGSDSLSIEYKEFGVRLTLTPTVVGRNRISLKVAPEVSELDFTAGITIAGTQVPALNVRRTDTSVSLADGESFIISGLISTNSSSTVDKLPFLGDVPVLGAFFRSSRIEREERELLMVVTPRLVQPMAADAELPELPGEQLRNYDPGVFRQLFLENGDFHRADGLSR
ncbi:pilus assembly protein CpaC [Pseudomonas sp. BIGb0408]|uniref:Pilus assembly protein CpaC n=1 Tax=Phytopseudomonas flavescens TaxID=29435 RepID=A0A7Y9XSK2_9GAMM|nr:MULTISPECIES: type II and III secretion system protein family protein [Pseudomonas]MCW2289962.1 pilus assembly protein CpaC [Pseudomonas sp. BIGb0408]NYH75464.1 pilus assembly protein CpaC [Pseudomonas flavescens]